MVIYHDKKNLMNQTKNEINYKFNKFIILTKI